MRLAEFLRAVYVPAKLELSPEWLRQIEVTIGQLDRWAGEFVDVERLTEELVRAFLAEFRQAHAPTTTNNKRRDLLALWQCAYEEGLVDRPPRRSRVPRAQPRPTVPEAWTPRQVASLLSAAGASGQSPIAGLPAPLWWRSLILVLYDTGERRSAALAVRTEDMDLVQSSVIFRRTKTGRMRWAPLHPETSTACRAIYDLRRPLMWPWPASMPALEKRFRKLCIRAGIPHGQGRGGLFHKLRRTSGSLVEANGGDGARHLGNTRGVFERSYRDPRITGQGQLEFLPRPS